MIKVFRNSFLIKPLCVLLALNVILLTSSFTLVPKKVKIPAGTLITLKLLEGVTTKECSEGDPVNFSILYDVMNEGKKIIPAGTRASGKVVKCEKAKGLGKPGTISIDVSNLVINGSNIPLSTIPIKKEGDDNSLIAYAVGGALCLLTIIGGVAVFFIKGGEGEIDAGKMIEGRVSSDSEIYLN
jgi:hypothetical protein